MIAAVDRSVGGVLVFGDRGTGKTTAVRAMSALLPPMDVVSGCRFNCDPGSDKSRCSSSCNARQGGKRPRVERVPVPVVDLQLGATGHRRARYRAGADQGRKGVRARAFGARQSRIFLYRRGQSA